MNDIDPKKLGRVLKSMLVIQAEVIDIVIPEGSAERKLLTAKLQALAGQARISAVETIYKTMISLLEPEQTPSPTLKKRRPALKRVK